MSSMNNPEELRVSPSLPSVIAAIPMEMAKQEPLSALCDNIKIETKLPNLMKVKKMDPIKSETTALLEKKELIEKTELVEKMELDEKSELVEKTEPVEKMELVEKTEPVDKMEPVVMKEDEADDSVGTLDLGCGVVLTKEMIEEERRLQTETMNLEQEIRKENYEDMAGLEKELRYKKLQFLLSKSSMYTKYLQGRMEVQAEELQKRRERASKRAATKAQKEEECENKDEDAPDAMETNVVETRTTRNKNKEVIVPSEKRGKKRKAGSESGENNKISNYFQEALARSKRQKLNDGGEKQPVAVADSPGKENTPDSQKNMSNAEVAKTGSDSQDNMSNGEVAKNSSDSQDNMSNAGIANAEMANGEGETSGQEMALTPDQIADILTSVDPNAELSVRMEDGVRMFKDEEVSLDQPVIFTGGILREYQVEGYKWCRTLFENGVNGILADEMGLGKTIQCIALISHLVRHNVLGPFLICAPLSTVPNWVAEFKRFAPKVPVLLYHGTKDERHKLRNKIHKRFPVIGKIQSQPVIITSYEIIMNDRHYISNHKWSLIIVDEGHRLKNFECRLMRELKMYNSTHRMLLTGTPLQNNLGELWSLLNFLLPEIFDDLTSFEAWFDMDAIGSRKGHNNIIEEEQAKHVLSMLHKILSPFVLRRLKVEVDLVIPPKREILVYAPLTTKQEKFYSSVVDKSIAKLVKKRDEPDPDAPPALDDKGRPVRKARLIATDYNLFLGQEEEEEVANTPRRRSRKIKDLAALAKEEKEESTVVVKGKNVGEEKEVNTPRRRTRKIKDLAAEENEKKEESREVVKENNVLDKIEITEVEEDENLSGRRKSRRSKVVKEVKLSEDVKIDSPKGKSKKALQQKKQPLQEENKESTPSKKSKIGKKKVQQSPGKNEDSEETVVEVKSKQRKNKQAEVESDGEDIEDWVNNIIKAQDDREIARKPVLGREINQVRLQLRNTMAALRKACNHPYLIEYPLKEDGEYLMDENLISMSGKMMLLDRMLNALHKGGHKVLIFSQMTQLLDILQDYCCLRSYKFSRLDGSMKIEDRNDQIQYFREEEDIFIFLLSTRAGGLGINLTAADTCIIFDSDWNPQSDLQAQDRCHRIGQERPVMVYRFVTANTIDQRIVERATAKRKLEKMVILKGKFKDGIKSMKSTRTDMDPTELLKLLQESDYHATVGANDEVITDAALEALLDRSDLTRRWHRRLGKDVDAEEEGEKQVDIAGVFKVMGEEDTEHGIDASS